MVTQLAQYVAIVYTVKGPGASVCEPAESHQQRRVRPEGAVGPPMSYSVTLEDLFHGLVHHGVVERGRPLAVATQTSAPPPGRRRA